MENDDWDEDEDIYPEQDWNSWDNVGGTSPHDGWNEDEDICPEHGWNTWDNSGWTSPHDDWNEAVDTCPDHDWNAWNDVLSTDAPSPHDRGWTDDDDSSDGEWSVQVLKHHREWNDTESEESNQQGNTDVEQNGWNIEVLDTKEDWNIDDDAATDGWRVGFPEHVEDDLSTECDHTKDSKIVPFKTETDWGEKYVGQNGVNNWGEDENPRFVPKVR